MPYGLSPEQIDWMRDGYRMFREGDPAFMERFAPDAEFRFPLTLPAGGTYEGPFAALEFWTTIAELFESPYPDPEEFLRVDDRLVVVGTWRARSRQTGDEVTARFIHVFHLGGDEGSVDDLKFTSVELFVDTAAMLGAADPSARDHG